MLQVQNLSYQYDSNSVLKDISLNVQEGEIIGVLGPNGAGKSTLFQLLNGLKCLQEGTVNFLDTQVGEPGKSISPAMRLRLGVVFQEPSLDGKLSAFENLDLCGQLFGISKSIRKEHSTYLLKEMGLLERANEPVKRWSVGMRRQLEVMRAMIHKPRLLLMDEPTASLDPAHCKQIWELLKELATKECMGVCLTTHRMDEADNCDRLYVLFKGCVVASDTPEALKNRIQGDRVTFDFVESPVDFFETLKNRFSNVVFQVEGNCVHAVLKEGHLLIPRVVDMFHDQVRAVHMRKPTLADAYLHITGEVL